MKARTDLERRHLKSARLALYVSLVLTLAVGLVLTRMAQEVLERSRILPEGSQDWFGVDWQAREEVRLFQEYLQIDTNSVDGSEVAGARFLAEQLEAAGLEVHLEQLGERKANLWAILEGDEPGAVVLHNHIDVEPVRKPEKWDHPPFSGKIDGPWIYGRGAFDMKSLAIAQLVSVLELARSGERPGKSVIFLATGSEEVGSDLGALWVLRQHPELVDRFDVVLTEGGVVEALDRDEVKYWGVSYGQKRYVDLVACSPSRRRLRELRQDIRFARGNTGIPYQVLPEVTAMLPAYAPTRQRPDYRQVLENPETILWQQSEFSTLPDYLRSMFRNEAHPFPETPSPGGGWEMVVKLHLLPGETVEAVRPQVVPDWALWGLDWYLVEQPSSSSVSPIRNEVFETITGTIRESYPGVPVGPYFLPRTATDARFFRLEGIPSYGVSPFLILTPDTFTGNNPNERVSLPGFTEGVGVYKEIVARLADD